MITEAQMRKFTRATQEEMEKIGIVVKMPKRSGIADITHGYTWDIDVLAENLDGTVSGAQVQLTDSDLKMTTYDQFFRMLNQAIARVVDYRVHVANAVKENPEGY